MSFPYVWIFFEGKNLPISMFFVKCESLKGKGVHKGIFAAAAFCIQFRSLQQPASDALPSERFADKKIPDAKPIPKGFSGQSGELSAHFLFQEYADRNALGCLAVREILFL